MINRLITMATLLTLSMLPLSLLKAEDYPQGYLGSGYREYLSGKIQNGYFVEVFTKMDTRQKERVNKRNQVEEIVNFSYQATPESTQEIFAMDSQQKDNSQTLNTEIAKQRQQREKTAAAENEFKYIPYEDGRKIYLQDGLTTRVENEKVVDELGNVSRKNTYHMRYDERRLLTSYEAEIRDVSGNTSYLSWYDVEYNPDAVFYADEDSTANKNFNKYSLKETDPLGNVKLTRWQALSYEGKFLRAFSQSIEDSIYGNTTFIQSNIAYENTEPKHVVSYSEDGIGSDGLLYSLARYNTTYNNKDQVTGYEEKKSVYDDDGKIREITKAKANFTYEYVPLTFSPDIETPYPDKLLQTKVTTTTETPDGASRTETAITEYSYGSGNQVLSASGRSDFSGGDGQGNNYQGDSKMSYRLYHGKPELTRTSIVTNSKDVDGSWKYEVSFTDYRRNWYGLLLATYGSGHFIGGDGQGNNYLGLSNVTYKIINGRALPFQTKETIYAK